jgi:hypothetical protein
METKTVETVYNRLHENGWSLTGTPELMVAKGGLAAVSERSLPTVGVVGGRGLGFKPGQSIRFRWGASPHHRLTITITTLHSHPLPSFLPSFPSSSPQPH